MTAFDHEAFYEDELNEHASVLAATRTAVQEAFRALVDEAVEALQTGGKLLFAGNGGSAADAQHLATELTVRYKSNRRALAAIALTTDSSALTATGNDLGFEHLFSRQIEALGKPGDLFIAISTSGASPNILHAARTARGMGLRTAALTSVGGDTLARLVDVALMVPSNTTARIQEMHILLGQMLCGALEHRLDLA